MRKVKQTEQETKFVYTKLCETARQILIEYMKVQWADIHHCRNQEWKVLVIMGGVFVALFVKGMQLPGQIAIIILGLIVCGVGIYISIAHWIISYSKVRVIEKCERELGIEATFRTGPLAVQGAMILLYFLLAGALFGFLVWLLSNLHLWPQTYSKNLLISIIVSILIFVGGFILCIYLNSRFRGSLKKSKERHPKFPLIAELSDLTKCLNLLGQRPLKLIANEFLEDESQWDKSRWSFSSTGEKIKDKKLLLNLKDEFQFSIGDEHSKQDFHVHHKVYEIFASYSKMEMTYFSDGREKIAQVSKGVFI
ncbi:unnamed protein product, partial [marine sediment metagenome]